MAEVAAPLPAQRCGPTGPAAVQPATPHHNTPNPSTIIEPSYTHANHRREVETLQSPYQTAPDLIMNQGSPVSGQDAAAEGPIDPITRQILERTQSQYRVSQVLQAASSSHTATGASEESAAQRNTDSGSINRVDSNASSKLSRDKRKGVSFLSRIMGGKKREDSFDLLDNDSEMGESRPAGNDAEVFSQPIGFIPRFPAPPKYIKVKTQNRKQKDFDRVFLAQVLLGEQPSKNRKSSDAQIVSIDEVPQPPTSQNSIQAGRAVWAMEFSKDGRYLAAAGQDKKVRVWAVISNAEDREAEERGSETGSGSDQEEMKLNAPVCKSKLIREYDGHTSSILDLSWSKNNFLLSSSMDKTVRLYHVSRAECLCAFKHNDFVTSIQFHPKDDRFFLAGSLDSKLRLWSIPDKNVAYWAQVPDMVTAVAFTPDGKTALAGCLNGMCILYDTEGLKAHSQIHVRSARGRNAKGSKITGIDTISVPRDGGHSDVKVLITSNDSRIRMYNLKDRNLELKFRGNENSCSQIHATFSDDGKYVICGSEDRRVYIWPTGPVEKGDPEKRPMEVFEAHSTIVTTALLAPTKTRILLAQSGDPVYDICNPPPVTLLSRSDSVISSKAPTEGTGHSEKGGPDIAAPRQSESPKRAPETPAYLARHAHSGGNIIVTADYTGHIKIFRQDCAYQKRRQDSWDYSSVFSKKVLGRSASIATRTSVASSLNMHRQSLNLAQKNPSADRIISWRNSISSATTTNGTTTRLSVSEVNLGPTLTERMRPPSPKKSLTQRLSLRPRSSISTSNGQRSSPVPTPPASIPSPTSSQQQPEISISSPTCPGQLSSQTPNMAPLTGLLDPTMGEVHYNPIPHEANDPLFLLGQQSFMYWNMGHNLAPMVQHAPRTPEPSSGGSQGMRQRNPLSRRGSAASGLSSEVGSSTGVSAEGGEERREGTRGGSTQGTLSSRESAKAKEGLGDEEDDILKCENCGNETFRTSFEGEGKEKQRRLRCRKCGKLV